MASIRDFKNRLRRISLEISRSAENENLIVANDALALVKRRIIGTGNFADGKKRKYAPSTKRSRSKRGRQINYVDLSDSGRMWANTGVRVVKRTAFGATARITGRNSDTRKKLGFNSARYKINVLELTQQELRILRSGRRKRFLNKLRAL